MQITYPVAPEEAKELDAILAHHRAEAESKQEQGFCPWAARSVDHKRYFGAENDHRLPYKRDVDRILHSKAYARYIDKTQVAHLVANDHLTNRSLHVQLVSNFSRGVAEILGLNLDLVEAVALGHDVGHPPFGHEGERCLSALSQEFGNRPFAHAAQSCRLLFEIEPLNLGLTVYDGFLCHNGGLREVCYSPQKKGWEDHFQEKEEKRSDPNRDFAPMSLEGCLVKLCDTVSYLGRDLEDAIRLGILRREEILRTRLGQSNREILGQVAADVIRQSFDKEQVALSNDVMMALRELRAFNFERIYNHPAMKVESSKIERSYRTLFEVIFEDWEKRGENSHLFRLFLYNKPESYVNQATPVEQVIDYIAGMTNNYFIRTLKNLVVPSREIG